MHTLSTRSIRLLTVAAAVAFLAVALGIRALGGHLYSNAPLPQYSGTALYASMVYAGVIFLRPRIAPITAGAIAIMFCWLVEAFQVTGIPAELSTHSLLARFALGAAFDWTDILWYPVGVIALVVLDAWLGRRRRPVVSPE